MNTSVCKTLIAPAAIALVLAAAGAAHAGSLENMERERAIMIETMLSGDIDNTQRQGRLEIVRTRLIDLERMVLRDDKLTGRNTPVVRRAFENYDLTFLASAAAEFNVAIIDNWLAQLGLTTQSLMATEVGRR